ncbi:saccharopine dehydrogenase NADP-binding domain-containing protein [Streptomyces sp. MUM 178J]|uniref:saccharopine dehydrogenase NADP-binding domain-containing protein n=1 Tax=Streptomyces sp. MUM 178J TaxID=2791991 RepID=UPI001F043C4B|nr:saccharopine dehydrogenase NADP-binding domain-containing protein [Streptomyces sp. MUM 178J]WRQ82469.1 saccharopine dehydrogenase NADP-binding domain-containing protein [Streptomyces sp. MUM 178J]
MTTVLIIGAGDMGERVADGLAAGGRVGRLLVAGRSSAPDAVAATVASARDCRVEAVPLDASRLDEVAGLLTATRPDLVVHCASMRSPWAMSGRSDPAARAVTAAGLALRLPYQLPLVLNVMRAVRAAGHTGPVANLSFPDVTGPVLARLGLAPAVGLGNAAMMQLRVRAALRAAHPDRPMPLIRVLGHHAQVFDVMQARRPADPQQHCRVHLGEDGQRDDSLAYQAPPLAPGPRYNVITAAAVLPVLEALLPGAGPLRHSTAAPAGLPGGYPVRIADGSVALDLPPGLSEADAIAFNERMAAGDGVDGIDDDGTVRLTAAARRAVAEIAPDLADPIAVDDLAARAARLDAVLA